MSVTTVTVTSTIPLSDTQKGTLIKGLEKKYGAISVVEKIDENIVGGLKVTVGSTQFDASLTSKLDQLKHSTT